VRPELRPLFSWPDNQALRAEIAAVVPSYAGIERLAATGDAVQWGGRHLAPGGHFPTPSGRGRFTPLVPDVAAPEPGGFVVTTRRGKQFNSMIHGRVDPLTGAGRDAVFMDGDDAARLGLAAGDRVVLRSGTGRFEGSVALARLPVGTLQVHWPEGNVLVADGPQLREPASKVPDYTAVVTVERP
jgi:anaerobic selenocysteine-containing dehydrogenase